MKLKFSIRKELIIGLGLLMVLFLIAFSERKQGDVMCKGLIVELVNTNDNHFLDESDVLRLVEANNQTMKGTAINRIDLKAVEKSLTQDRHIRDAELYGDLKGNLIVRVELRRPVARIVRDDAPDAYIAADGIVMDVSDKFSSRVMILSGEYTRHLVELGDLHKTEEGNELMKMIEFITDDPFWRAQIAQMDIKTGGEITIYPQVTGQLVEFGMTTNYQEKFRKLMVFYKEILPQKGWTRYERVNLTYDGQVIAQ